MIAMILLLSFVSTVITWLGLLVVSEKKTNDANHYEKIIPLIEARLKQEHIDLMKDSGKELLEQIIPGEGIKYRVVNSNGVYQYGSLEDESDIPNNQLLEKLNRVDNGSGNYFVKYIPIISDGSLQGALLLYYTLKVTPINESEAYLVKIGSLLFLLAPFGYIILFTAVFVRRLSLQLKKPLDQLMEGTSQIRDKNLQFSFNYSGNIKEINELTIAFEQMRDELGESLQREWNLQKQRKEAIAALAHDIRTPLTIIQGHVEGLEESHKRGIDRFERYVPVIKSNMASAVKLVSDLNETAILESDSFMLNKVYFDPFEYFTEKMEDYEILCAEEGVLFIKKIKDERYVRDTIYADPYRLTQVLDNLISNSLRFVDKGTIRCDVNITKDCLAIKIADGGPGFPDKQKAKLFESFYQGSRKKGHAGLGLYIAKSIVEKHDGRISAENGEDGGAVVTIFLPI
jgi:signal transduction histidine kinase